MAASILSLPDECLQNIVSFVDDPFSFGSIALTCKRFLRMTENDGRVMHTNLLKSKAEYYIKLWVVNSATRPFPEMRLRALDGPEYDVDQLLRECATLTAAKNAMTYDKVMAVWERNGPVAAELFTWVRDLKSTVYHYCSIEKRNVTLHFPKSKESMVISACLTRESTLSCHPRLSIKCGDLSVGSSSFSDASGPLGPLDNFIHWTKEEVERATGPMKSVIKVLQKELGETIPSITPYFFLWLCHFFPYKSDLLDGNRLCFKDASRNMKPTRASVDMAIADYNRELQLEDSLQKMFRKWKSTHNRKKLESEQLLQKIPTKIEEIIRLLSLRSEAKVLERLTEHYRFYWIANKCNYLENLDNKVVFDLLWRTSLEKSSIYKAHNAIPIKHFENQVLYRCIGGKYMKVWGAMHDADGLYSWEKIELEFTLPDDKVLKLESPFNLHILSPVTDLLQEGITDNNCNLSLTGQGYSQRIDNFHTANYFLSVLDFNLASNIAFHPWDRRGPMVLAPKYSMPEEDWSSDESSWPSYRFPESEEENE